MALLAPLLHAAALGDAALAVLLSWLYCRALVVARSTLARAEARGSADLI